MALCTGLNVAYKSLADTELVMSDKDQKWGGLKAYTEWRKGQHEQ